MEDVDELSYRLLYYPYHNEEIRLFIPHEWGWFRNNEGMNVSGFGYAFNGTSSSIWALNPIYTYVESDQKKWSHVDGVGTTTISRLMFSA